MSTGDLELFLWIVRPDSSTFPSDCLLQVASFNKRMWNPLCSTLWQGEFNIKLWHLIFSIYIDQWNKYFIYKEVQSCTYVGLLGLAVQSNSSNCQVLITIDNWSYTIMLPANLCAWFACFAWAYCTYDSVKVLHFLIIFDCYFVFVFVLCTNASPHGISLLIPHSNIP